MQTDEVLPYYFSLFFLLQQLSSRVPSSKPKARQQLPKVSQYDDVSDESDREPSARASDPHDDQDEAEMEDVGWEAEETDNEDERSSAGHGKLVDREVGIDAHFLAFCQNLYMVKLV